MYDLFFFLTIYFFMAFALIMSLFPLAVYVAGTSFGDHCLQLIFFPLKAPIFWLSYLWEKLANKNMLEVRRFNSFYSYVYLKTSVSDRDPRSVRLLKFMHWSFEFKIGKLSRYPPPNRSVNYGAQAKRGNEMKKVSMLFAAVIVIALCFSGAAVAEQGNFIPPKYDKNKVTPDVVYFFPQLNHHTADKATAEEARAAGYVCITVTKYKVDTDGDGQVDLWHVDYDLPAHEAQDKSGLIINMPATQTTILYVGVNADESECERILFDLVDKNDKPGRDGIYEKEKVFLESAQPEK
ncbi:MAG: hypothetical protein V1867_02220 [Candidatus Falkowbacteria bacterium]